MKRLFYTFSIFLYSIFSFSQINPPDFICVKNDTLFWNIPTNTCGPFVQYEIYVSDFPDGPFTILDSVDVQSQTSYFPGNQGSNIQYYYLVSNHDCPGQTQISSDTLDNRPPKVSQIQSASVEGGMVELTWYPSPSPEVIGYIIYRETPVGVVPIDTIFNGFSFNDPTGLPTQQSETYFVNALDECGNTSIFDLPHRTILLDAAVDACSESVVLNWNLYQNWTNGIGHHEIWISENGDTPFMAGTASGDADSFVFENANDLTDYCFVVRAVEATTGVISNSNEFCLFVDVIPAVQYLFIKNVSVNEFNNLEVTWEWNTDAEITGYNVLRSIDNENFEVIASESVTLPLNSQEFFIDNTVNPSDARYFYIIETIDICGAPKRSKSAPSVFLSGTAQTNRINQLFWTAMNIDNLINIQYELFKLYGNSEEVLAEIFGNPTPYLDPINPRNPEESRSCYYLNITSEFVHPETGEIESIQTNSNTICLEQFAEIIAPNAFTPKGRNPQFRPLVILTETAEYQMLIYNRFGEKLFESNNLETGWNGRKNGTGENLPQGPYTYYIKVVQPNGRIVENQGVVILLR